MVALNQGDYAEAKAYLQQALTLAQQLGSLLGEASQLGNLGLLAYDQEDYAAAKSYLEQSVPFTRAWGCLSLLPCNQPLTR